MFCTITSLVVLYTETSVDFCVPLMTSLEICLPPSPRLQGLLLCGRILRSFQPAVPLSHLELICHHFHQLGNTSFSNLITRTGFWDSLILPSPLLEQSDHNFCLLLALLSLSWVLGSHPWLFFFFLGPWVPSLAVFSFFTSIWHVFHQTYCSLLACFLVASGESSAHLLADSFSDCLAHRCRLRSGLCFVLQAHAAEHFSCITVTPRFRVSLHATLLSLVVRGLRHQPSRSPPSLVLDACFLSFAPVSARRFSRARLLLLA